MKLDILNEKQNALLRRKEIQAAVHHENEPTPSKDTLQQLLSKQLGEAADKIDVRSIYSEKGRPRSVTKIFIWEEPPPKKKKKEEGKAEKKEEEKTETKEEKAEAAPAEKKMEKKEEKKEESASQEKVNKKREGAPAEEA